MTRDNNKFLIENKEKGGSFTFGDNAFAKVVGKGTVSLGNVRTKVENILLVEDLKHNLLSFIQMCDQVHTLTFNSQEIRKESSSILVAIETRTPNNVYNLNEIKEEKCCMVQIDEIWLWNRRMGNMSFDNLVKVRKKYTMRYMLKIIKPPDPIYKQCQHGKQTKVSFKAKEY